MEDSLKNISQRIKKFTGDRGWDEARNPKDLAIYISLEANEILEHFHWKNGEDMEKYAKKNNLEIAEEISDVMVNCIALADMINVDIIAEINKKMDKNEAKYPVEKCKGKSDKYTAYEE